MRQSPQAAARRYARALLDIAQGKPDAAKLKDELRDAARLVASNAELARALNHPGLGLERRQRLLRAVFAGHGSDLMQRLLMLLAEKDRLALLPEVAVAYARAWNEQHGVLLAQAVSAQALDEREQSQLKAALESATGRTVEVEAHVDAALVGGLVVTLGGRTYDGSVRAQLGMLRERLVGGVSG
jgi:F-type H+-transporting ATPase subunit delta